MINNFCICTLTHSNPDRGRALKYTVSSFMEDYTGDMFEWFIWVNITDDSINESLEWIQQEYSNRVKFNIHVSNVNLGPGGGINRLSEMSKEYEYSIFLEGDWLYVPNKISGLSHNWIQDSIKFLNDFPDVTHIQLRKYLDDLDDRQYTYGYWMRPENVERIVDYTGGEYIIMKERMYTNTPCLRRMSAYYDLGIFPLKEFYDEDGNPSEHKGKPMWGQAELSATKEIKAAWLHFGAFVHFEDWNYVDAWDQYIEDGFGCNVHKLRGHNRCKYGYMTPNHIFCSSCSKDEDITGLVEHSERYQRKVLPLYEEYKNNPSEFTFNQFLQKVESIVNNPTINREFIDYDLYKDRTIIRKKPGN
jgi:hypothetical protein